MHRGFLLACILLVAFFGLVCSDDNRDDTIDVTTVAQDGYRCRKLLDVSVKPPKNSTKVKKNDVVKTTTAEILTKGKTREDPLVDGKSRKMEEEEDDDLQFMEEERKNNPEVKPEMEAEAKPDKKSGKKPATSKNKEAAAVKPSDEEEIQIEDIPDLDDGDNSAAKADEEPELPEDTKSKSTLSKKKKQNKPADGTKLKKKKPSEDEEAADVEDQVKKPTQKKLVDEDQQEQEQPDDEEKVTKKTPSKKTDTTKNAKDVKPKKPKTDSKAEIDMKQKNSTKKGPGDKKTGGMGKAGVKKDTKQTPKDTKQIPITFPDAGAEDVEDLHSDAGLPKRDSLVGEDEEEEDFGFLDDFSSLPTKFQETAGQVANTLRPGIQKISETTKGYFSQANQHMRESLTPIMGEQVAPWVASLISYGLLVVPLGVVLYVLERIRATFSLAKVLFFINLYLAAYFLTLVLATFALGGEPMAFFFRNSPSSYIFLQLLQVFGYAFYAVLYVTVAVKAFSKEGPFQRLVAVLQIVLVALFGLHYYVTVFHRAMATKVPRTTWKVYTAYSMGFSVLCLVAKAKIERTKKEYYYTPADDPDEAIPIDKRS